MDARKIEMKLKEAGEPKYRAAQVKKAIFQDGVFSFLKISTISKELREKLEKEIKILSFNQEKILTARDGQSIKALLKLEDGNLIETVLISPKPGLWSACISSQVGCAMGCRFCATGKMGFIRNLTAEEITDQVLFWKQYLIKSKLQNSKFKKNPKSKKIGNWDLPARQFQALAGGEIGNYDISNVVYMGMGEPFLNWDEVQQSLKDLISPELFGFGSRSISVSTSGIGEGIENFGRDFPQVNLAISLHFAGDKNRSNFMPVNNKYNLEKIKRALQKYFEKSNRKVFIEYILLEGINDSREDAMELVNYLKSIGKSQLLHVNLIRYNTTSENLPPHQNTATPKMINKNTEDSKAKNSNTSGSNFWCGGLKPSSGNTTQKFKNYLHENNINVTIRKSLGEEIQGACGQLAGK